MEKEEKPNINTPMVQATTFFVRQ